MSVRAGSSNNDQPDISGIRPSLAKIDLLLGKWGGRDISILPPQKPSWLSSLTPYFKSPDLDRPRFQWVKNEEKQVISDALGNMRLREFEGEVVKRLEKTRALKAAYEKTHYLFTHSSEPDLLAVYLFYREFERLKNPSRDISHWVPFRGPNMMDQRKAMMEKRKGVQKDYEDELPLISADLYDLSTRPVESAIYFVCSTKEKHSRFVHSRGGYATFETWSFPEKFKDEFSRLVDQCVPAGKKNISWAILVPHALTSKVGYLSHWYAQPCRCFHGQEDEIFKQLQRGFFTKETGCKIAGSEEQPPQYRLYPEELIPENGVIIEYFSNFSNREIEEMTRKLAKLAEKIYVEMNIK